MSYLARFRQLAEELQQHPKVRLLSFQHFAPVSEAKLLAAEQQLGHSLHASITDFYKETNGLQLRWIFEENEELDPTEHQFIDKALAWDYGIKNFRVEDGMIFLLPFENVFLNENILPTDFLQVDEQLTFCGEQLLLSDLYARIRPFDEFSSYCDTAFYLNGTENPPLVICDEQRTNFTDSRLTNFNSYLEFLLATKGLCVKRKSFYGEYKGHRQKILITDQQYWENSKDRTSLDGLLLEETFPLANQTGTSTKGFETKKMQARAYESAPVTAQEFAQMQREHAEFLASGGAGGTWSMLLFKGIVLGSYRQAEGTKGKQAIFDMKLFPQELDLQELQLPYSSWCGAWLKYHDLSDSDLQGSIMVDAMLEKTIFADANLKGVDFSRANLKDVSFMNANLSGVDFENCDLTNADFRGANLEGARFPGAILKNVKR